MLREEKQNTEVMGERCFKQGYESLLFDGINANRKALYARNYSVHKGHPIFDIYMLTQPNIEGKRESFKNHLPVITGTGILCSLMLEDDCNRFICSMQRHGKYFLSMNVIEETMDCLKGAFAVLVYNQTDFLFIKTACVRSKKIYLGITDQGEIYMISLDKDSQVHYVQKQLSDSPKRIIDISVDNSVKTKKGFRQKVALLTDNGEVLIAHLGDRFEQINVMHVVQVPNHQDIKHLYYRDGKVTIVYKKLQDIFVWNE